MGSLGVACSLPFVVSLGVMAIASGSRRWWRSAALATAFAAATLLIIAMYFWGFERGGVQSPWVSAAAWAKASLQFLTMAFGPMTRRFWPVSGLAVAGLTLGVAIFLGYEAVASRGRHRTERLLSLLALASPVVGALAVGLGRQLQGGLAERYALYAAPFACVLYAIVARYAPARVSRFLQMTMLVVASSGLFLGFSSGLALAKDRRDHEAKLRSDIDAGLPVTAIVARHGAYWGLNEDGFRQGVVTLKQAGHQLFRRLQGDPQMAEVALSTTPDEAVDMRFEGGWWVGAGRGSKLVFRLPKAEHVYAVRFAYLLHNRRNSTTFVVTWHEAEMRDVFRSLGAEEILVNFNSAKARRKETQSVWIDDKIDALAISPCPEPCQFQLVEMSLLVPAKSTKAAIPEQTQGKAPAHENRRGAR